MAGAAWRNGASAGSARRRGGLGCDVVHPRLGAGGLRPRRDPSLDEAAVEEVERWKEAVGQERVEREQEGLGCGGD